MSADLIDYRSVPGVDRPPRLTSATVGRAVGAAAPAAGRAGRPRPLLLAVAVAVLAASVAASLAQLGGAARSGSPSVWGVARGANAGLPLGFVPNAGQWPSDVRFATNGAAYGFSFRKREAVLAFSRGGERSVLSLRFLGAAPTVRLDAEDVLPGKVNYLVGPHDEWRTGLATYGTVVYRGLWPGIDLAFRGERGMLKYEFRLAPGANAGDIRLAYRGADRLSLTSGGALRVHTSRSVLRDSRPVSYQRIDGRRVPVESRYALGGEGTYGFAVGAHDARRPLVIDPGLDYSTYLGGAAIDTALEVAVDGSGAAYVVGYSDSPDFPTTPGAYRASDADLAARDAFVAKLDQEGSRLVYSTYLGGTGRDEGIDVKVDAQGRAYAVGYTTATDFPTTSGAFQPVDPKDNPLLIDGWVAKLSEDGSALVYSTYLSGVQNQTGILGLDLRRGHAYVCGGTDAPDFPTTPGAYDRTWNGGEDAFVTKLSQDGSELVFSTFVGGSDGDHSQHSCAVDPAGDVYVGVGTKSSDYPTTPGAFQPADPDVPGDDAAVTKLGGDGSTLGYSTYVGGPSARMAHPYLTIERFLGLDVDESGRLYGTGQTDSAAFPTTPDAFDPTFGGGATDVFAIALESDGSELTLSTYLGGSGAERADAVTADRGHPLVTGRTTSTDFPTTDAAVQRADPDPTGQDAFLTKLGRHGAALLYSTYLGGTGTDSSFGVAAHDDATAFVTGMTDALDFPTTPEAAQPADPNPTGRDGFVIKLRTGPTDENPN